MHPAVHLSHVICTFVLSQPGLDGVLVLHDTSWYNNNSTAQHSTSSSLSLSGCVRGWVSFFFLAGG